MVCHCRRGDQGTFGSIGNHFRSSASTRATTKAFPGWVKLLDMETEYTVVPWSTPIRITREDILETFPCRSTVQQTISRPECWPIALRWDRLISMGSSFRTEYSLTYRLYHRGPNKLHISFVAGAILHLLSFRSSGDGHRGPRSTWDKSVLIARVTEGARPRHLPSPPCAGEPASAPCPSLSLLLGVFALELLGSNPLKTLPH